MKRVLLTALLSLACLSLVDRASSRGDEPDYGKIADAFQTLADEFRKLAPASPNPPAPLAGPQLPILTPARVAVLQRMQAENHAYWQVLKATADRTVAGNPIYDDLGQAAAIVYRTTGDKSYAAAAWAQLTKTMAADGRAANDVRQRYADYQLIFAWLADSLSADQTAQFGTSIQQWSNYSLGIDQPQYTGSFRLDDSDQTVGQFFGLCLQDALKLPPGNLLSQSTINLGTGKLGAPVGGLTATAADSSTVRNTINRYVSELAAGGEWPESSQYDANTVRLLVMGWLAHCDLTGQNAFPEIAAWIPDACRAALVDWTPGLEARVLWGDNDHATAGGPNLYKELPYLAALQAAANRVGASDEAAQIGGLIQALQQKYPQAVSQAEIHFFLFCDPYAPTAAYRTPAAPQENYSPGVGLYRRLDGSTLFLTFSPTGTEIDHMFSLVGSPRLFAGGEWVLSEPISYGGTGQSWASNSIAVSGISSMRQQGFVAQASTAEYSYLNCLSVGPLYDASQSWSPPPVWCHELRRQILYLPKSNLIVCCDRLDSEDPLVARPDLVGYTAADAQRIKGAAHRHEWFWNCPAQPTVASNSFSYVTAGKQTVRFDWLSPTSTLSPVLVDESQAWATTGIPADQLHWDVQLNPTVEQQWDCIVWTIRLDPSAAAPALVTPSSGVAGVSIDGTAVLFSAAQGSPALDPATAAMPGASKTYLVGCSGPAAVVVK